MSLIIFISSLTPLSQGDHHCQHVPAVAPAWLNDIPALHWAPFFIIPYIFSFFLMMDEL